MRVRVQVVVRDEAKAARLEAMADELQSMALAISVLIDRALDAGLDVARMATNGHAVAGTVGHDKPRMATDGHAVAKRATVGTACSMISETEAGSASALLHADQQAAAEQAPARARVADSVPANGAAAGLLARLVRAPETRVSEAAARKASAAPRAAVEAAVELAIERERQGTVKNPMGFALWLLGSEVVGGELTGSLAERAAHIAARPDPARCHDCRGQGKARLREGEFMRCNSCDGTGRRKGAA